MVESTYQIKIPMNKKCKFWGKCKKNNLKALQKDQTQAKGAGAEDLYLRKENLH